MRFLIISLLFLCTACGNSKGISLPQSAYKHKPDAYLAKSIPSDAIIYVALNAQTANQILAKRVQADISTKLKDALFQTTQNQQEATHILNYQYSQQFPITLQTVETCEVSATTKEEETKSDDGIITKTILTTPAYTTAQNVESTLQTRYLVVQLYENNSQHELVWYAESYIQQPNLPYKQAIQILTDGMFHYFNKESN